MKNDKIKIKKVENMARRKKKTTKALISLCLVLVMSGAVYFEQDIRNLFDTNEKTQTVSYEIESIPDYNGSSYVVLENNQPDFSEGDYTPESFEEYSELDSLNRCGVAFANVGKETMPTEERGSIGQIKPSGWHTVKYDIVSGKYLYNRCHLIGYQLTGENANEKNLITCTRQMNTEGMLEFENQVADYVQTTNNHVLYRVTPVFENDNLVAKGVQIEASSVEDHCGEVCFNVFVYNVQDGIEIDYKTGDSKLLENN